MASRRRRFHRVRRAGGRFRRGVSRHPKLATRIANGIGLLIMFNQEIGSVVRDTQSGLITSNPAAAGINLLYNASGYNANSGIFTPQQLTTSVVSKAGGYIFAKVLKFAIKRMRVM